MGTTSSGSIFVCVQSQFLCASIWWKRDHQICILCRGCSNSPARFSVFSNFSCLLLYCLAIRRHLSGRCFRAGGCERRAQLCLGSSALGQRGNDTSHSGGGCGSTSRVTQLSDRWTW